MLTLRMRLFRYLFLLVPLLAAGAAAAQTSPAEIAACRDRAAGIYHSYEPGTSSDVPVPEGYEVFYISHYGRHGSRYHASPEAYEAPLAALRQAAAAGVLTPAGRELLRKVECLADDARSRYGDLTPRGAAEHRGIAERMFRAWPALFSTENGRTVRIESRATLVPRCILSMAAFNERLKELNPALTMSREASERYLPYLASGYAAHDAEAQRAADSLLRVRLDPARFVGAVLSDPAFVDDPLDFMQQLYVVAGMAQDAAHLGLSCYDLFTVDELYALWESENALRYLQMGPSAAYGDAIAASARPLLGNIVETAQRVMDGREPVAVSLRFGHDAFLMPLLSLLRVEGASTRVADPGEVARVWSVEKVSPMAANIQFIFFRNGDGDVKVRVLHNEHDARLPLAGGPYYDWEEFKDYCEALCR